MEEVKAQVKNNATKVATKWALIYLVASIIITYAFEFLNVEAESSWKFISYIPFIGLLFLTQKEYRDELRGFMTFGEGFSAGFRYSVFTGLLVAIFSYLYFKVLSPHVFEKLLDTMQTQMENKGASEEKIEKFMNYYKSWGALTMSFGAAVGSAILGAIISLIGAAIFKKERSAYDIVDDAIDPTV